MPALTPPTEEMVRKARRLRAIMDDSDFLALFTELKGDIVREWESAKTPTERELCHARLSGVNALQQKLKAVVMNGEYQQADRTREILG